MVAKHGKMGKIDEALVEGKIKMSSLDVQMKLIVVLFLAIIGTLYYQGDKISAWGSLLTRVVSTYDKRLNKLEEGMKSVTDDNKAQTRFMKRLVFLEERRQEMEEKRWQDRQQR